MDDCKCNWITKPDLLLLTAPRSVAFHRDPWSNISWHCLLISNDPGQIYLGSLVKYILTLPWWYEVMLNTLDRKISTLLVWRSHPSGPSLLRAQSVQPWKKGENLFSFLVLKTGRRPIVLIPLTEVNQRTRKATNNFKGRWRLILY